MNELKNYIKEQSQRFIDELVGFCSQPSVASENRGMKEMADLVEQKLKNLGAEVKKVSVGGSYPFLLAELKSKTKNAKTLLIYNHYDVQPEEPIELWNTPPFEPTVKDGVIYARGVEDDKGNLLFRLQAIEAWQKVYGDLPVNVKWIIEGEEEIGSPHLHELSEKYGSYWKDADVCLWETGGVGENGIPMMTLGLKGIVYIELSCEFNEKDMHSGRAAIADSPVWRLVHALASMRDAKGNVTIDGFSKNILKPNKTELKLLKTQSFDPKAYTKTIGASKTLAKLGNKQKFLNQMYFTGTANIAGIWGGYTVPGGVKTVLPNKATAKIDLRLVLNQSTYEVVKKIRKHLDKRGFKDVQVKLLVSEEAGKTNVSDPFVQKALSVLRAVYKKNPYVSITSLGSGPVYYVATKFGIPFIEIGASNPSSAAHAPNENITIKDYFLAIEAFSEYLNSLR